MTLDLLYYLPDGADIALAETRYGLDVEGATLCLDAELAAQDNHALISKIFRPPNYRTPVLTIEQAPVDRSGVWGREWTDRLNQVGNGKLSMLVGSPEQAELAIGDVVRHYLPVGWADGRCMWGGIVTKLLQHTAPRANASQPITDVTLAGIEHDFARAAVMPSLGLDRVPVEADRAWGWMSPSFVDDDWGTAKAYGAYGAAALVDWFDAEGNPLPHDWSDAGYALWIGPTVGTATMAPSGNCYYRHSFSAPSGTARLGVRFAGDDGVLAYFDGSKLGEGEFDSAVWVELEADEGEHLLAFWAQNAPDIDEPGDNPTGVIWEVWTIVNGKPDTLIDYSGAGTTKIVEYPPAPPSMTIGEILYQVLAEWQDAGWTTGWTIDFDGDLDSKRQPWIATPEITTKVGTSGETFLFHEIAGTWADLRAVPGERILQAYNIGTMGHHDAFDLHAATDPDDPESGTLTEITHESIEDRGGQVLAQYQGGWRLVGDGDSVFALGLGSFQSAAMVDEVCTSELEHYSRAREQITVGIVPSLIGTMDPGDTGSVPDSTGSPTTERLVTVTVSESHQASLSCAVEIKDPISLAAERHEEWLRKLVNGTVDGTSRVAQPIDPPIPRMPVPATPTGGA